MRLYCSPLSSNSRRVLIAADELGIPLERVAVDLLSQDDRKRLLELNPNSKLPVLDHDGFLLWESCAIMQYLAGMRPDQTLYPTDPRARAQVDQWMFWACQHFAATIGFLNFERLWKGMIGMGGPDPVVEARFEGALHGLCAVLDAHLAQRTWLVEETFSLADIALAPPLMYIERGRLPVTEYAHLMRWFERVQQRTSWQRSA